MKYVIKKVGEAFVPIVFGEIIYHNEVARRVDCISAGFVKFTHDGNKTTVKCHGKSSSLKLGSNAEMDEVLISKYFEIIK